MDQRKSVKEVIEDAIKQADQKASEVYEQQTLPDYLNYRGEEYRGKLLECVDDPGFYSFDEGIDLANMGYLSCFPVVDFSLTYMNKPWEDLSKEDKELITQRDYGPEGLNEEQRATLTRYFYVIDALRHPYDIHGYYGDGTSVKFSDSFEQSIEMFAQSELNRPNDFYDKPDEWKAQLRASAPKILDFVMACEDEAFDDVMRYNAKANLKDYDKVVLDAIQSDPRLEGKDITVNMEDVERSVNYAATVASLNQIGPEEFSEDFMKVLYLYGYQGGFENPAMAQMYQEYVKQQNILKGEKESPDAFIEDYKRDSVTKGDLQGAMEEAKNLREQGFDDKGNYAKPEDHDI